MSKEPNIFEFATKELSQDAFLCWLLSWAKEKYKTTNRDLYYLAKDFIVFLTGQSNLIIKEVKRQEDNIDVLVIFENNKALIIEDKTNTFEHSDQINRYIKTVEDNYKFNRNNIYISYFKTGYTSNQEIRDISTKFIHNHNFKAVSHTDIFNFFTSKICKGANSQILNQWWDKFSNDYEEILKIEEEIELIKNFNDVFIIKKGDKYNYRKKEIALDKITNQIIKDNITLGNKDPYWYICDQGETPHICLYEKYSVAIEKYSIHHGLYLMFRGTGFNFTVKQHVCIVPDERVKGFSKCNKKGLKNRVKAKDYGTITNDKIIVQMNSIRERLKQISNWKEVKAQKDNLMILKEDCKYTDGVILKIKEQKAEINKIIKLLNETI